MTTSKGTLPFPSGTLSSPLEVLLVQFAMKDWGLAGWQADLALVSPVFRRLLYQINVTCPERDDLQPLSELWEAAGSPPDKSPTCLEAKEDVWLVGDIEDRGKDGVWADFEVAAWYAEFLCEHIGPEHVCEMCY